MRSKFDHLIVLGRPASGKSEFIDYIKSLPDPVREKDLHIAAFEEVDDFPWIWEKFMEDDIWESVGYPRIYSFKDGDNRGLHEEGFALYDFCLAKFNRVITKRYIKKPEFYDKKTLLIEFSRGGDDGYAHALPRLSKEVLDRAAIFYVKVSADESWRRNVARYEEKLSHSILAHMVPKRTFDTYYKTEDWDRFTGARESGKIEINGVPVPFVTMNNEPELPAGPEIAKRYKDALEKLFELYNTR